MKIKDVAKLEPIERFLYWIKERHLIYKRRSVGRPKPWTDDEVLQSYFFTNPYRENDKTTVWFCDNIREPLRNSPDVLFATVCFRWFNLIATGEILLGENLLEDWKPRRVKMLLKGRSPVFTGAFMIPAEPGTKKVDHVCTCLAPIWKDRFALADEMKGGTLQNAHEQLLGYPYLGKFMAYEVVTDLRHTYLLENADDIMTWANPGPGCIRGLMRLDGIPLAKGNSDSKPRPKDWQKRMKRLLSLANKKLRQMPKFEMREIEHSLCEWDKYERARLQDGRMKRLYQGV